MIPTKEIENNALAKCWRKNTVAIMEMQKWRMVFSFKINECVSSFTSLYVVPFTYKLYFTQVIFTVHMVPDR